MKFAATLTFKGKQPIVTLVEDVYQKGVKLSKQEMGKIEAQIERLPDLKKWFVNIIAHPDWLLDRSFIGSPLINDILDVSKIAAGKLELEIAEVSIAHLSKSSLAFVKQQAERKQIQLNLDLQHQLGKISVDRRRMTQVAIDLLANAVKFTPQL